MGRRHASAAVLALIAACALAATAGAARTLDIYFIDVEGGQSTLIVTPTGESLLVDTGFPGPGGGFDGRPGDPKRARDAQRILAAARTAGVKRIDNLLITHFHGDHDGGTAELAQLMPIRTFIDHGSPAPDAEERVAGTVALFDAYAAVRAKGRHLEPQPGDHLPLTGVDALIVSSAGKTLTRATPGAGQANAACGPIATPAQETTENPRSTGLLLTLGKFRFLDVGDLSGPPLFALVCPNNLVGQVEAYLVAHHGGVDAADLSTFAAIRPRVAIVNNGATKGGAPEMFATLHRVQGLEDTWQLHRSTSGGAQNFADAQIANLDETTGHWIKLAANADGSFTMTNARTGGTKRYAARAGSPARPALR